jgi:hypothetical protein
VARHDDDVATSMGKVKVTMYYLSRDEFGVMSEEVMFPPSSPQIRHQSPNLFVLIPQYVFVLLPRGTKIP